MSLREEVLNDLLVGIYDECNAPALKKDKTLADFVDTCACRLPRRPLGGVP